MMKCKICGINLYKNITFCNMFKLNYIIHQECLNSLVCNVENQVIPIEENIIIYDYVFNDLIEGYNEEYLWSNHFHKVLDKYMNTKEWSMVIILDVSIEKFFNNNNPYLVINLTKNPILVISLEEEDLYYLEGL